MNRYLLLFIILVLNFNCSFGQKINVSEIESKDYPSVSANFSAFDSLGNYYTDLTKNDFRIFDNGLEIKPELIELECTNNLPVNVVLVLDKSSSMNETFDGETLWQWTLEGAKTFINTFPLGDSSKIAIIAFSGTSKLVCDFSADKDELIDSMYKLPAPYGSTNFNDPFFLEGSGAFELLSTRPSFHRRAIIFLSDGEHESGNALRRQDILDGLNEMNIRFFGITLMLDKSPDLDFWSLNTAGKSVFIASKSTLNSIYKTFAEDLKMTVQCRLEWQSPNICDISETYRKVDIHFLVQDAIVSRNYRAPEESIATIEHDQSLYDFGDPPIGQNSTNQVEISPKIDDFLVTDIRVVPNEYFEILDYGDGTGNKPNFPLQLQKDQLRTIKIKFTPAGIRKFHQSTLMIDGFPCPVEIPLYGGYQQLTIDKPLDGSAHSKCDTVDISWSGVGSNVIVDLFYSRDGGQTWILIEENVRGNNYQWFPDFDILDLKIKAKVTDQFGFDYIRSYGGSGNEIVTSIAVQNNGLYNLATGYFTGSMNIAGFKNDSPGNEEIFIAKFDIDGNPVWVNTAGSLTKNDRSNGISIDPRGFSYITGSTYKGVKFGDIFPNLELPNKKYLFLTKYSASGKYMNSAFIGATTEFDSFEAEGLKVKSITFFGQQNKIAVIGKFKGYYFDYDLNVALSQTPDDTLFTAIFDEYLNLIELYPGVKDSTGFSDISALHTTTETSYKAGNFTGNTVIEGENLTSSGVSDFWISKYAKNPVSQGITDYFDITRPLAVFPSKEYDFGPVVFGDEVSKTVTGFISNTGKLPYKITWFTILDIAGNAMLDFTMVTDIIDVTIYPGESIEVEMIFKPSYLNRRSAILTVYANCAFDIKIGLIGDGVCGGTALEEHNFGDVNLNKQKVDTLICVYQNISETATVISPLIRGKNISDFQRILPDYVKAKEFNGKITVGPGECIDIIVVFEPKSLGLREAELNFFVQTPCKNSITRLIGTGISSDVGVTSYDWKERRINGNYKSTIEIINNSNVPELIENIQFEDGNINGIFGLENITLPTNIPANGKIILNVEFNPKQEIPYSENILIYLNSREEALLSELRGVGILPKLTTSVSCGDPVNIGQSTIASLILSNPSNSSVLRIYSVTLEGNDEFEFVAGTVTTDIILDIGESITLPVLYTPISGGDNSDNFRILADDYDGLFTDPWRTTVVPINCDGLDVSLPEIIDFGDLIICTNRSLPITILNKSKDSDLSLYLSQMDITGSQASEFIAPNIADIIIKGGQSYTFDVQFAPQNKGTFDAVLNIPNSMTSPFKIDLKGVSKGINLEANVKEVSVLTGEKFKIILNANLPSTYSGSIANINIEFSLDPSVAGLILNSFTSGSQVEKEFVWGQLTAKGNGKYEISGTGTLADNRQLELMSFDIRTYLNDKHSTVLIADLDYTCSNDVFELTKINTGDVCMNDARLIQMLSGFKFGLSDPSPNPASETFKLNYSVGFEAETQIEIFNYYGERVRLLQSGTLKSGDYSEYISTKELSSGTYIIRMISGPYSETQSLMIVK